MISRKKHEKALHDLRKEHVLELEWQVASAAKQGQERAEGIRSQMAREVGIARREGREAGLAQQIWNNLPLFRDLRRLGIKESDIPRGPSLKLEVIGAPDRPELHLSVEVYRQVDGKKVVDSSGDSVARAVRTFKVVDATFILEELQGGDVEAPFEPSSAPPQVEVQVTPEVLDRIRLMERSIQGIAQAILDWTHSVTDQTMTPTRDGDDTQS